MAPGEPGVAVVAGHRDTHFEVLRDVLPGTEILIEDARGQIHRFAATAVEIVDASRTTLRIDADVPIRGPADSLATPEYGS